MPRRFARLRPLLLLPLLTLACGPDDCDGTELSDAETYWLQPTAWDQLGADSNLLLEGTQFLVYVDSLAVPGEIDEEQGGLQCVGQDGSGVIQEIAPATAELPPTMHASAVGEGAVEFLPPSVNCPANTDVLAELGADSWAVRVVEAAQVEAKWIPSEDARVAMSATSPGPRPYPADFITPFETVLIPEHQPFYGAPLLLLRDQATPTEVRYDEEQVEADELTNPFVMEDPDSGRTQTPAGTSEQLELTIAGHPFTLPELRAVSLSTITELELVPVYYESREPAREWGPPRFVVALARDAEGRRVVAPPVEWTLHDGELDLQEARAGMLRARDLCSVSPDEATPSEATVEARLGELVARVPLEWTALPSDPRERDLDTCERARGCAVTDAPPHPAAALLMLLALACFRRRSSAEPHCLRAA